MRTQNIKFAPAAGGRFALDTTFVLFFLAVDLGLTILSFGLDSAISTVTLAMLIVFPYFLPCEGEKPEFSGWVSGRLFIAAFGIVLGLMLKSSLGVVLPEMFRLVPLTLLIVAAMISCYIQFYGIMKVRLAR